MSIPDKLLWVYLKLAEAGDTHAARDLVKDMANRLRGNQPLPENLRNYLITALDRITGGGDAGKALHLADEKKGPKTDHWRNFDVWQWVTFYHYTEGLPLRDDRSHASSAFSKAGDQFCLAPESVEKIYYNQNKLLLRNNGEDISILREMACLLSDMELDLHN